MTATRLEANVHIVTGARTHNQNVLTCVNKAGIAVQELVLEQLAAAEAVLTQDEREMGVLLMDIGGGTTDYAVFLEGNVVHTNVLPVGAGHFTSDISVVLRTPMEDAERIKKRYGCALASLVTERRSDRSADRRRTRAEDPLAAGADRHPRAARGGDREARLSRSGEGRPGEGDPFRRRARRRRRGDGRHGGDGRAGVRPAGAQGRAARARRTGGHGERSGVGGRGGLLLWGLRDQTRVRKRVRARVWRKVADSFKSWFAWT